MNIRKMWSFGAVVIFLTSVGCAGSGAVRHAASQLQLQVSEYQRLIDDKIQSQNTFYQNQVALIEQSRQDQLTLAIEEFRRTRSAEMASKLSISPADTARLAGIINYLIDTTNSEYTLYQQSYESEQKLNLQTEAMITKLQRQRDLLDGVKANLNELSTAPKRRAQMLLSLSEDVFNQVKW